MVLHPALFHIGRRKRGRSVDQYPLCDRWGALNDRSIAAFRAPRRSELRTIDTLRMEKGYVYWSTDVTPDTTPWEAGLSWRVNLNKGDFLGRDALVAQREAGITRQLCTFTLEAMAYPVSGEAIIADGEVVGFTTSANFGHTVGKPIVYGYLPTALAEREGFIIEVYGEPIPAKHHDRPLYDPDNLRLKS